MQFIRRRRLKRRARWVVAIAAVLAIGGINAIAYMQARSMTHYVDRGSRTSPPESLNIFQKIEVIFTGVELPGPVNGATPADIGLQYQTLRFGGAAGDDCEAWYLPSDSPKALCIEFHAYDNSKSAMLDTARAFHDLGDDVLLVDFRGSGGSVGNKTSLGYFEAEDVAAAVNLANQRWPGEPIILYGRSMGGAAIFRAVGELGVHPRAIIVESVYDRLLTTVENRFHAMGLPAFPLARLLVFWGGAQEGYDAFKLNPADYAMNVRCPVLVMQGSLDPRVTNADARDLFDHLAGPKELEIFDDCRHCDFLSKHQSRWNATVTAFLRKSLG